MGHISVTILWICLSYVKCSVDQVFALKGCNATLEWGLGNLSFMDRVTDIRVLNASHFIMAWTEDDSCLEAKGVSVYCEIRKHGENWLIHVVLIYVTMGNSGRYTCRVQYGITKVMNFTKELMVIDKPQILIPPKSILNHPLDITCTADPKFKGVTYQWKLNGTYLHSTGRIYARSSLLRLETLLTADKSSKFSCELCQQNSCCITSEPFALDPYYGPDKLALDRDRRNIFLRENEAFTIKCSADCNPVCSVWWEGYINSNNEILVINSFDSRMAGPYICKAKNLKTDMTTTETIFLHHAKVYSSDENTEVYSTVTSSQERTEGLRQEILWMGPIIVSVFLIVIGCLMIACHWRQNKRRKTAVQQNKEKRIERFECSYIPREPSSLQDLSDLTNRSRNQSIKSMTLQTLSLPSDPMERKNMHRDSWPYDTRLFSGRNRPDMLLAKQNSNDNVVNDNHNNGVNCQAINNSRQEDLRSANDKDALWIYDQVGDISINESSHEVEWSTEHRFYDYARSIEIKHVETADVHITDGAYITPISDLSCPIQAGHIEKMYERASEQPDMDAKDGCYITPFIDCSEPFEICQVEETDLNETD